MSSIINKPLALSLNRAWQVLGFRTIKQAIIGLNGGGDGIAPALAMDMDFNQLPDGSWDFQNPIYMNPVKWDEWIKLPIRAFDLTISTARMTIRVPTVIISTNYSKMPLKRPRVSRQTIYDRDQGICQFTNRFVGRAGGNLDHVVPRDRGGKDTFENLVWASKEINSQKANLPMGKLGLKLIRVPKSPMPVPYSSTIRVANHPTWLPFLTAK